MFSREVVEKILLHCDGKTLKVAEKVCVEWQQIVEYLVQKHNLWHKCVHQDIPAQELLQYKSKWLAASDKCINWEQLYENWMCWHDIKQNIQFHKGTTWKINKISCFSVIGDYIAIGLTNGSVKVFNKSGSVVETYRHLIVQVQSIHFVRELPTSGETKPPTELLIAYQDKVIINDFRGSYAPGTFYNCYIFSSYKNFMCSVSQEGHITIAKVSNDEANRKKSFQVVTYARIYSPDTVKSCTLWENVCLILVNDKVRVINYKEGSKSSQFMAVELTTLQFSNVYYMMRRDVFIFHDKVIITVTKSMDIMQQQLFELFILNDEEKRNSKKMFVPWEVFNAFITCVYLYGNTLVIGLSSGVVYFYVIDDWKLFDIANYSESIGMTDVSPIISIDAVESYEKREFYIASNTFVRKVIGQTVR